MASPRPEVVDERLFKNVYICMRCNARIRTKNPAKTKCRRCGSKRLRHKKKMLRGTSKK